MSRTIQFLHADVAPACKHTQQPANNHDHLDSLWDSVSANI